MKRFGVLPGLTQDEDALHRFLTIVPHIARTVQNFLKPFPLPQTKQMTRFIIN